MQSPVFPKFLDMMPSGRIGGGRAVYVSFFILYHIFFNMSNRSARTLQENIMHMTGRQNQQKNCIWGNRSATPGLTVVPGRSAIARSSYKVAYDVVSRGVCGFGKPRGHIDLLEVGEKLHMGYTGRKFGPGQLSTARRTRQKEKRGAVARLSYRVSNI